MLHIVGFGANPRPKTKTGWKWYSDIPVLKPDPSDMLIINLLRVEKPNELARLQFDVHSIDQTGGVLVVAAAPVIGLAGGVINYGFLPWPEHVLRDIHNIDSTDIHAPSNAPEWIRDFERRFHGRLSASVVFGSLAQGGHILLKSGGSTVSLIHKHGRGQILIIPSLQSVLLSETTPKAQELLASYLECIQSTILVNFEETSEKYPMWLDSILIRNESELRKQFDELRSHLDRLKEEKSILAATGASLTRKVASLLEFLGFQVNEKESSGREDIGLRDGDFRGVVECSGSKGFFNIDKVRQLMDYVDTEGAKGMLIVNPSCNEHPAMRDLSKAFTKDAVDRARKLGICLVTVPHLYRVCLRTESDKDKLAVRESLKHCSGLWLYPADEWPQS